MLFEARGEPAGTVSRFSVAPVSPPPSGAFQQDMFGARIGLRDSSGGAAELTEEDGQNQEQPSEDSLPENPEDVKQIDYEQDKTDEATQSGRRVPKANDAALQRFMADEERAAWLAEEVPAAAGGEAETGFTG